MIILYTFIKESYIDKYRSFVGGIIFMVMNESVENYLETILVLNHRLGNVRSIDIANECPRCTYQPHNQIYEQVILNDSMTYKFI